MENALDAGASYVEVTVRDGGKKEILVRDNGSGLSEEDAKLAVKRYATSKISSADDLNSISTFGFRGEALSSIASVSKFSLKTAEKDAVKGTEITSTGGSDLKVSTCAHPQGTTVIVKDLFYNLPARRKFLKTTRTEFNHIKETVTAQALIKPRIGFSLQHNGKQIFTVPKNQDWGQRITALLDWDLQHFAELEIEADYISLRGYLGLPELARKRRPEQYIFVNNRPLYNKTISGALYSAYENLLPQGVHPPYIIDLKIRPDLVDVNVHPRKEEVKFISPNTVFSTVKNAAGSALSKAVENMGGLKAAHSAAATRPSYESRSGGLLRKSSPRGRQPSPTPGGKEDWRQISINDKATTEQSLQFYQQLAETQLDSGIYQLAQLYIVIPVEDGLLIYDQHAAHERVLLEKFKNQYKNEQEKGESQELMFALEIELKDTDCSVLAEYEGLLSKIGLRLEGLDSGGPVLVKAVPVLLKDRDVDQVLKEFVDDLYNNVDDGRGMPRSYKERTSDTNGSQISEGGNRKRTMEVELPGKTKKALTYLACRSAVKQGDRLTEKEMYNLIEDLEELGKQGLACPHGRPTRIKLSLADLGKMFKRR